MQGVGYGIVVGLGLAFSLMMVGVTKAQNRYTQFSVTSIAEFTSASHSVKPGLIAAGIVSAWTWAATLLQSSAVAYRYGISGPWWYAAGATVQVFLFAQNAAKLKVNAPHANTFLEVIRCRWPGKAAHLTFLFFSLATNIIVSSMLMTGGSATMTDLTGMSTPAACMLIPVGVILYVLVGGMRASLIADYIHTTVLYAILLTFAFTVYATSDLIGSPAKMHELLTQAAVSSPVADNHDGSYLTFRSLNGLIFGVINVIGNFATVFNDQAYWQRAIASEPVSCVKAFMLGGSAWLAIPLGFASSLGLAAVALTASGDIVTPLTDAQISAGLAAPTAAAALLGKAGGTLMLILLFLAVTSAASAELVAVSSLLSYDFYVPFINPRATERQILIADHVAIVFYGIVMGVLGVIFFYSGVSMGYLYELMGTLLGSAVVPIALAIMSKRANKMSCIVGAWVGVFLGVMAWLVCTAKLHDGVLDLTTTFDNYAMLTGNLTSIGVGAIIAVGGSLIWPEDFDFAITRALNAPVPEANSAIATSDESDAQSVDGDDKEKATAAADTAPPSITAAGEGKYGAEYQRNLDRAFKTAVYTSIGLFVILILVIPLPLFFSNYIFPTKGFTAWIAIGIAWLFYGSAAVVLYPIYESRKELGHIGSAMIRDIFGGGLRKPSTEAA